MLGPEGNIRTLSLSVEDHPSKNIEQHKLVSKDKKTGTQSWVGNEEGSELREMGGDKYDQILLYETLK